MKMEKILAMAYLANSLIKPIHKVESTMGDTCVYIPIWDGVYLYLKVYKLRSHYSPSQVHTTHQVNTKNYLPITHT